MGEHEKKEYEEAALCDDEREPDGVDGVTWYWSRAWTLV